MALRPICPSCHPFIIVNDFIIRVTTLSSFFCTAVRIIIGVEARAALCASCRGVWISARLLIDFAERIKGYLFAAFQLQI